MGNRLALYPGTFDPFTLGHLDVLQRARELFGRVRVVVASDGKSTLFTLAQRLALVRECVADLSDCEVAPLEGLLVDEARRCKAAAIVRGIRSLGDYQHEWSMALMNQALRPDCETVFLLARPQLAMLSSSIVREVARHGGDVGAFVPAPVAVALRRHFEGERP